MTIEDVSCSKCSHKILWDRKTAVVWTFLSPGSVHLIPKSLIIRGRGCFLRIICFSGRAVEYKFDHFSTRPRTHLLLCSSQATVHPHNEGEVEIFFLDQNSTTQPTCKSSVFLSLSVDFANLYLYFSQPQLSLSMHTKEKPLFSHHPLQLHIMNADAPYAQQSLATFR